MTLKYFQKLCVSKQYRRVLEKGVCVAERRWGHTQLLLFQIDWFYIEITFHDDEDAIVGSRSFALGPDLTPYLDDINLSELAYECSFHL
jgi:hypothetical protein